MEKGNNFFHITGMVVQSYIYRRIRHSKEPQNNKIRAIKSATRRGYSCVQPPSAEKVLYGDSNVWVHRLIDASCPHLNTAEEMREQ
jgi:hypothetical protein